MEMIATTTLRLLACAALLAALSGCMREPEPALRIGTNVWIGSEPLYLARELGHLDLSAVQLVEYPSASEVLRAYRNQAIDGMVISLDELFSLAVDGLQPRAILVVDVSHGADAVVGRRGMRSMRDLKGRPVAVESGALGAFVLSRAPRAERDAGGRRQGRAPGVERAAERVREGPGRRRGHLRSVPRQLLRSGATTLFDSTQIPGDRRPRRRARRRCSAPNAVRALLSGWFAALAYMKLVRRMRRGAWASGSRRPASSSWKRNAACMSPRAKKI
jgi:NitT/TauT family transport system substrate-binding protein